ncbi:MAG: hypothetical protein KA810_11340, partial [Pyrinomonadaceae bacterium]|nr:hypothetical protein [Pyrinomonadaceae bacterium]
MKNRTNTRRCGRTYNVLSAKTLILAGFAVIISLAISSLALYTRPAATQDVDKKMPTVKGDAAVDYLKKDTTYDSLANAFKSIAADDLRDNPEAMVKLTPNDGIAGGFFGSSVAISGNTAIIGATNLPEGSGGSIPGAAYIFVRNGASWSFQQKLTAPDSSPGNGNAFGDTVGISGDTVVVAAPYHDVPESYSGAAYVFVRTGTTWALQKRFTNADTPLVFNGDIGFSVAISGDTVLVTAFGFLQSSPHRDFVHVFVREGTTWTIQATLITGGDETFTSRVAISGNTVVIGNPNTAGTRQEAAYIYVRCGTTWTQQQRLIPSDGSANIDFGGSVAISGNTVIIGAETDQLGTNQTQTGSAYIYVSDGTTWTEQAKLTGAVHRLNFGRSVGILGNTAIIGAHNGTFQGGTLAGGAEVFVRSGTTWTRDTTITAPDGQPSDFFGYSVAISSDVIFVGATYDDFGSNNQTNEGSAWAIDRTTAEPPPFNPCETEIEVNITTDQPDADIDDDVCDVDENESGEQCSLRAAIETANAKAGPDEISFNIPGAGAHTISPATELPVMFEKVLLDATTQPGYSASPLIALTGTGGFTGLAFDRGAFGSSVSGMAINRFFVGISITSSSVKMERNYIGLDPGGSPAGDVSVQQVGIAIRAGSADNTVGGIGNLGNVISNNTVGVEIGSGATGNKILGNKIGTNPAGTLATANETGVLLTFANENEIGDGVAGSGNIISGNAGNGIRINQSSDNTVKGNIIGLTATGEPLGNGGHGILLTNSSGTMIGGEGAGDGNMIGANTGSGIEIIDDAPAPDSDFTRLFGNLIGCFRAQGTPIRLVGNGGDGIRVIGGGFGGAGLRIGSAAGVAANTILDNGGSGILLNPGPNSNKNSRHSAGTEPTIIIEGNNIGVAPDSFAMGGIVRGGNALSGVLVKISGVKIGGIGAAVGNSIGANVGSGILIEGPAAEGNEVLGNFIGAIRNAQGAILAGGNGGDGIKVSGASVGTKIGGIVGGAGNTILNNAGNGVLVETDPGAPRLSGPSMPTLIEGNNIGLALNPLGGAFRQGNSLAGLRINQTSNVRVGGEVTGAGNSIGENGGSGIEIVGEQSADNIMMGNMIGMLKSLVGIIQGGNGGDGVRLVGTGTGNRIGGSVVGAGNTIIDNGGSGILVESGSGVPRLAGTGQQTVIEGNKIGVAQDTFAMGGILSSGNALSGVLVKVGGVKIGGTSAGAGNSIGANVGSGIQIEGSAAELNEVMGNFIGGIRNLSGQIQARGNNGDGVRNIGGAGNRIGGAVAGAANTIINNGGNGILVDTVSDSSSRGGVPPTVIEGNNVGVALDTFAMGGIIRSGNVLSGVLAKTSGVKIGGMGAGAGNSIGANVGSGIKIEGPAAQMIEVMGNMVGGIRDSSGQILPGGNGGDGVNVGGGAGNKIGGNVAAAANMIVNNAGNGVTVTGASATDNEVHGNLIGTTTATIPDDFPLGAATTGNGQDGIVVRDAPRPQIGRADTSYRNVVAHNAGNGVRVDSASGTYSSPVYVYG